jgi:hypothetical protein
MSVTIGPLAMGCDRLAPQPETISTHRLRAMNLILIG